MLPFTQAQFLELFAAYNQAIWPAQIAAYLLGLVALACVLRPSRTSYRLVAGVLAAMWLWTGIAYHAIFFSEINKAAFFFGLLFVVQGALMADAGLVRDRLRFGFSNTVAGWVGLSFAAYAAVLYPLIGVLIGHPYQQLPMFGVTPCPVVIFTFGMFLLTASAVHPWLLIVPFIWSLIGGSAAILLNVPQDWLLLASGFVAVPLIVFRNRHYAAIGPGAASLQR
jgi:hypothetical protein